MSRGTTTTRATTTAVATTAIITITGTTTATATTTETRRPASERLARALDGATRQAWNAIHADVERGGAARNGRDQLAGAGGCRRRPARASHLRHASDATAALGAR